MFTSKCVCSQQGECFKMFLKTLNLYTSEWIIQTGLKSNENSLSFDQKWLLEPNLKHFLDPFYNYSTVRCFYCTTL